MARGSLPFFSSLSSRSRRRDLGLGHTLDLVMVFFLRSGLNLKLDTAFPRGHCWETKRGALPPRAFSLFISWSPETPLRHYWNRLTNIALRRWDPGPEGVTVSSVYRRAPVVAACSSKRLYRPPPPSAGVISDVPLGCTGQYSGRYSCAHSSRDRLGRLPPCPPHGHRLPSLHFQRNLHTFLHKYPVSRDQWWMAGLDDPCRKRGPGP